MDLWQIIYPMAGAFIGVAVAYALLPRGKGIDETQIEELIEVIMEKKPENATMSIFIGESGASITVYTEEDEDGDTTD